VEAARRLFALRAARSLAHLGLVFALVAAPLAARADGEQSHVVDRWPLAYVLRPQTLPENMIELDFLSETFWPNHLVNVNPQTQGVYQFHPDTNAGASLEVGITDRSEAHIAVPRVLCFDSEKPSGCSPTNRYRGAGAGLSQGIVRAARVQVLLGIAFDVANSSPVALNWRVNGALKLLATHRLALTLNLTAVREIDPPPTQLENPLYAYLNGGIDLQVTDRLLFWVGAEPWAPLSHLDEGLALELYGGVSFTFNHHVQAALTAGTDNALAEPLWYGSKVPGSFGTLAVAFWLY
jgi:hypothetical protein